MAKYFSLKDKTTPELRASLVYKYTCLGDPDISYIGKTKRYLQNRINEHKKGNSAICDHIDLCDWCAQCPEDGFRPVQSAKTDMDLSILEALYIKQHNPKLNTQLFNSGTSITLKLF